MYYSPGHSSSPAGRGPRGIAAVPPPRGGPPAPPAGRNPYNLRPNPRTRRQLNLFTDTPQPSATPTSSCQQDNHYHEHHNEFQHNILDDQTNDNYFGEEYQEPEENHYLKAYPANDSYYHDSSGDYNPTDYNLHMETDVYHY